eukprot:2854744-Rhodomonas_salina.4
MGQIGVSLRVLRSRMLCDAVGTETAFAGTRRPPRARMTLSSSPSFRRDAHRYVYILSVECIVFEARDMDCRNREVCGENFVLCGRYCIGQCSSNWDFFQSKLQVMEVQKEKPCLCIAQLSSHFSMENPNPYKYCVLPIVGFHQVRRSSYTFPTRYVVLCCAVLASGIRYWKCGTEARHKVWDTELGTAFGYAAVSYTHLRAHETEADL